MKVVDFTFTKDSHIVRLCETALSDNSLVYDVEIVDGDYEEIFKTAAYDKKDAEKRFSNLVKALAL
jgi:hypothetical protein